MYRPRRSWRPGAAALLCAVVIGAGAAGCSEPDPVPLARAEATYPPIVVKVADALAADFQVVWEESRPARTAVSNDDTQCRYLAPVMETTAEGAELDGSRWDEVEASVADALSGTSFEVVRSGDTEYGGWQEVVAEDDHGAELELTSKSGATLRLVVPVDSCTDPGA